MAEKYNHVMIDLETMGTQPDAAIISIGAVMFSKDSIVPMADSFYRSISLESSIASGATMDASTVMWWMKQSESARNAFQDKSPLSIVLNEFTKFINENSGPTVIRVWGNGSDFDNVLLRRSYERLGIPAPWKYYNNRCFRTLKNLYPSIVPPENTDAHNALADAYYQAVHASMIMAHIESDEAKSE